MQLNVLPRDGGRLGRVSLLGGRENEGGTGRGHPQGDGVRLGGGECVTEGGGQRPTGRRAGSDKSSLEGRKQTPETAGKLGDNLRGKTRWGTEQKCGKADPPIKKKGRARKKRRKELGKKARIRKNVKGALHAKKITKMLRVQKAISSHRGDSKCQNSALRKKTAWRTGWETKGHYMQQFQVEGLSQKTGTRETRKGKQDL